MMFKRTFVALAVVLSLCEAVEFPVKIPDTLPPPFNPFPANPRPVFNFRSTDVEELPIPVIKHPYPPVVDALFIGQRDDTWAEMPTATTIHDIVWATLQEAKSGVAWGKVTTVATQVIDDVDVILTREGVTPEWKDVRDFLMNVSNQMNSYPDYNVNLSLWDGLVHHLETASEPEDIFAALAAIKLVARSIVSLAIPSDQIIIYKIHEKFYPF